MLPCSFAGAHVSLQSCGRRLSCVICALGRSCLRFEAVVSQTSRLLGEYRLGVAIWCGTIITHLISHSAAYHSSVAPWLLLTSAPTGCCVFSRGSIICPYCVGVLPHGGASANNAHVLEVGSLMVIDSLTSFLLQTTAPPGCCCFQQARLLWPMSSRSLALCGTSANSALVSSRGAHLPRYSHRLICSRLLFYYPR